MSADSGGDLPAFWPLARDTRVGSRRGDRKGRWETSETRSRSSLGKQRVFLQEGRAEPGTRVLGRQRGAGFSQGTSPGFWAELP